MFLFALLFIFYSANTADAITVDCMFCHSLPVHGGFYPSINTSLFGTHLDINSSDGIGNLTSSDCIVCHYSASISYYHTFPVSTYTCEDCHINAAAPGAPKVNNHIQNSNISVNAICSDCHNKTVNLFRYSANASAAHYGRNASFGLSPGVPYCAYCHSNSSTVYRDVMQDQNNSMIANHTELPTNPGCANCHNSGKIHDSILTKPPLTIPNSSYCQTCHGLLQKHNNTLNCTQCHLKTINNIHPVQYLQPGGTFKANSPGNKTGAVNCTSCHQGAGLFNAPIIPDPLSHSSNPASGGLWNGSSPAYWDSQVNACKYCHGEDKIHNTNPLGNISSIKFGNALNQNITNTSFWCANCHFQNGNMSGNYSYNATSYAPLALPPEIQNNSGLVPAQATDGTTFYNHTLSEYSDETCKICHAVNSPMTTAKFIHNVGTGGGGPDCISCHDIRGSGAPADKRIDIRSFNKSVHYALNNGSNGACWACHGDGTQPTGHPAGYKSPKKCSNDECHSLDQKFRAPMIYSHFKNASLNGNPTNIINYNVSTNDDCQVCHANSVYSQGRNINSTVSHFASNDLLDSINCIYCHLNEDNSKKWGNATLVYENRTTLFELNRKNNKFIAKEGESVDLGFGFALNVIEVSLVRESVLIEITKDKITVDKSLIGKGNYTYEEYLTIDNTSIKVPVIVINVTSIFKGNSTGFIQFEGFRLKRLHPEKKTTSCLSCHVYASPKIKYKVIERITSDKDKIFYTRETVNFTDKKVFNETIILKLLDLITDENLHVNFQPEKQKALYEGEIWNISDETSLLVKGVDTKSEMAFLQLRTGDYLYEDIVSRGGIFEFTPVINYLGNQPKNITIFRAKVLGIAQAQPKNMVIIEGVVSLSPEIKKILTNQTLAGYNASWLWENFTFNVGKIPENFHSPQVYDGGNGGGNCLSCHGKEGFSQKKVLDLGKHDTLNGGGDNACRACHGGTKDINAHPGGYKTPRNCISCHAATQDNYKAVYIGDEEHKTGMCETCHVSNTHEITGLNMMPAIKKMSLDKEDNIIILSASASAGYNMKIRGARYYIDSPVEKSSMYPVDGVFDSKVEDIFAQIDRSKLSPGKHVVYIEAMERNNKWGIASSIEFTIEGRSLNTQENKNLSMPTLADTLAILLIVFVCRHLR